MSDSEDDRGGVPLVEQSSDSGTPPPQSLSKRKREDEDAKPESKRAAKKRKQTKKPKDVDDEALDLQLGVNHAIAHMDSRLLADHLAQRTKRFQPDLSSVEAEDIHIPERAIKDTSTFKKSRATDNLADYVELYAAPRRKKKKGPRLSEASEEKSSPHTLVVAGAGLRAADLTRALRRFQTKDCMVTKLFAKHIKMKEAIEMVQKSRMGIGVGTPQRVIDLLDDGALKVDGLERIVVDASHIDQKKRGVLDMKETQGPLVQLLARAEFKERYGVEGDQAIELLFY
ncbi:Protein cms1 [Recurvomyces mirabilis]|nr:Protein cms1 [Recurvomyces mirabilis]